MAPRSGPTLLRQRGQPGLAERRGITPRIARRGIESSQRLGRHRYVVERSLAWLVGYRRLQVRYERRADILLGFVHLACALICLKSLNQAKV
jgi:transposase